MPRDLVRLEVSPTNRPGPFDFAIERVRVRRWPELLAEGLRRNPRSTRSAILTRLIGWGPESDNNLAWAIGATPLADFSAWRRLRARAVDLSGLDKPRFDWATAAPIQIVMEAAGADPSAVARSCESLSAQIFPSWRLLLVGGDVDPRDRRIANATPQDVDDALAAAPSGTLTATLTPGDRLLPNALAIVAEQARRASDMRAFYGDRIERAADGRPRPCLLPGWSPRLQSARAYLRAPVFVRDATRALLPDLASSMPPDATKPLRRMLVETTADAVQARLTPPAVPPAVRASVIIPTRDHPALLRRAVAAIRRTATAGACEIVVVDNGSTLPDAVECLAELRAAPGCRVLEAPGPFNFSAMCNDAAAAARGDVLVFLNDDTEVLSADWLDRLCARAREPATGAVGARLTYPDGRLQHVGVLLGMGGSAGHFGAPAPGDDPGWAGRNLAVHEVSAVTGACLAVAREKFEAVGGFDAADLPIELSDIDLCLKLNARGWQTIVDPAVHIMHEESASRGGATLRRLAVHDRERAVFLARWRHVLRDDPFFHPGLSLYSWREALG